MVPFQDAQLEILQNIVNHRSELLDQIFLFLSFFDTEYFFFLLIPIIWFGFSWRWGIRILFLIILSSLINYLLKLLFQEPRPFIVSSNITALLDLDSYAFPSAGAQKAFLFGGLWIYFMRKKWVYIIAPITILLLGFTRLYLGVHWISDVLGGYLLGAIFLFAFIKYYDTIEKAVSRKPYLSSFIAISVPYLLYWVFPSEKNLGYATLFSTGSLGIFFSLIYGLYLVPAKKSVSRSLRALIAVFSLYAIALLTHFYLKPFLPLSIYTLIRYGALSLWLTLGLSPLLKKLFPRSKWMNDAKLK